MPNKARNHFLTCYFSHSWAWKKRRFDDLKSEMIYKISKINLESCPLLHLLSVVYLFGQLNLQQKYRKRLKDKIIDIEKAVGWEWWNFPYQNNKKEKHTRDSFETERIVNLENHTKRINGQLLELPVNYWMSH